MSRITSTTLRRTMRHNRVRAKVSGTATRPRLCVFKSNKFTYASLVNDEIHKTLVTISSVKTKVKPTKDNPFRKVAEATSIGEQLAAWAKKEGITTVVFDRAGFRYTGRIKAVAEGARAGGLTF